MKPRILTVLTIAAVAATILCLLPRKSCASGTCGECYNTGVKGTLSTDAKGVQYCNKCPE